MKTTATILLLTVSSALAACGNMTQDQRYATGALLGGAAGLAIADDADKSGTTKAVATLAGAAAGASIAANTGGGIQQQQRTVRCVYPNGAPAPCPVGY